MEGEDATRNPASGGVRGRNVGLEGAPSIRRDWATSHGAHVMLVADGSWFAG